MYCWLKWNTHLRRACRISLTSASAGNIFFLLFFLLEKIAIHNFHVFMRHNEAMLSIPSKYFTSLRNNDFRTTFFNIKFLPSFFNQHVTTFVRYFLQFFHIFSRFNFFYKKFIVVFIPTQCISHHFNFYNNLNNSWSSRSFQFPV